jgi:nucleoside-diphosphate-sugar epimerase
VVSYAGRRVLVTGGVGFIGSNLVLRLVEEGAVVTVIDNLLPGCGSNSYNLASVEGRVRFIEVDIGDVSSDAIAGSEVIFNLAGEISHIHSMQFPERDLQVNTVSQLRFLLACAEAARGARIVYAGTRQVYGAPKYQPVDEAHPVQPVDFNGVHKYAATMYHLMLSGIGHFDAIVLRLTNVYGPRMALDVVCQGFLSTFLRRMVLGQPLHVYGDGSQLRDPVYVDDVVDAFLIAGSVETHPSRSYNVGASDALSLREIAETAARIAGLEPPLAVPFPADRKPIDIGSYRTDIRKIGRELGWTPKVPFAEGLLRTYEFYRSEVANYLQGGADSACRMPEHSGIAHRLTYTRLS